MAEDQSLADTSHELDESSNPASSSSDFEENAPNESFPENFDSFGNESNGDEPISSGPPTPEYSGILPDTDEQSGSEQAIAFSPPAAIYPELNATPPQIDQPNTPSSYHHLNLPSSEASVEEAGNGQAAEQKQTQKRFVWADDESDEEMPEQLLPKSSFSGSDEKDDEDTKSADPLAAPSVSPSEAPSDSESVAESTASTGYYKPNPINWVYWRHMAVHEFNPSKEEKKIEHLPSRLRSCLSADEFEAPELPENDTVAEKGDMLESLGRDSGMEEGNANTGQGFPRNPRENDYEHLKTYQFVAGDPPQPESTPPKPVTPSHTYSPGPPEVGGLPLSPWTRLTRRLSRGRDLINRDEDAAELWGKARQKLIENYQHKEARGSGSIPDALLSYLPDGVERQQRTINHLKAELHQWERAWRYEHSKNEQVAWDLHKVNSEFADIMQTKCMLPKGHAAEMLQGKDDVISSLTQRCEDKQREIIRLEREAQDAQEEARAYEEARAQEEVWAEESVSSRASEAETNDNLKQLREATSSNPSLTKVVEDVARNVQFLRTKGKFNSRTVSPTPHLHLKEGVEELIRRQEEEIKEAKEDSEARASKRDEAWGKIFDQQELNWAEIEAMDALLEEGQAEIEVMHARIKRRRR